MKLIKKIIAELGGDEAHAVTVCPGKLAYLRGVKAVDTFTPEKIAVVSGKNLVTVEGRGLAVAEYFEGDMTIEGAVERVCFE